jgi:hypothetical protein
MWNFERHHDGWFLMLGWRRKWAPLLVLARDGSNRYFDFGWLSWHTVDGFKIERPYPY